MTFMCPPLMFVLVGLTFLISFPAGVKGTQADADRSGASPRFDGPAELPRHYVKSSLADTPAPGQVRLIKQGDKLQEAIDNAACGDTLKLQAGGVFQGL